MNSKDFYKDLNCSHTNLKAIFRDKRFYNVPLEWYVVVADVKNSTQAVGKGNRHDVNLIAASSLIIALNIARDHQLEIPFFFTGDGGTVLVPQIILERVLEGLKVHNENSLRNFGLSIHYGAVSVGEIAEAGYEIKIAKLASNKGFAKPIVLGHGLKFAETLIKQNREKTESSPEYEVEINLEGLECRWDTIKPPPDSEEVVCYLIESVSPHNQCEVYASVLEKLDEIYGSFEKRNPLSLSRLKLLLSVNKIKKEMMARFGVWRRNFLISNLLKTFVGYLYFKLNLKISSLRGQDYLLQVISNADTLTIDGRISTIITGSTEKRHRFINFLNNEEKKGNLLYGHFINAASVMTCYIENRNEKHIHFVDGSDGGYTAASKELKMKFKLLKE